MTWPCHGEPADPAVRPELLGVRPRRHDGLPLLLTRLAVTHVGTHPEVADVVAGYASSCRPPRGAAVRFQADAAGALAFAATTEP